MTVIETFDTEKAADTDKDARGNNGHFHVSMITLARSLLKAKWP